MVRVLAVFIALLLCPLGCASTPPSELFNSSNDPFFQEEKDKGLWGKKKTFDRVYQIDPGQRFFYCAPSFTVNPPKKLAVLPFENLQGGDSTINNEPVTDRDTEEKESWSWTYSNRLRKFFFAYLSLREFEVQDLVTTDAVLQELGIDCPEKLYQCDPRDLGKALGVDAVIYGKVTHYGSHYLLLVTQVVAGLYVRGISTQDSNILFDIAEVRRDNHIRIATNPIDLAVGSLQNVVALRDLYMARASDEVSREVVAKIPVVKSLQEAKANELKAHLACNHHIREIKARLDGANNDEEKPLPVETPVASVGNSQPQRPVPLTTPKIHKVQKGETLSQLSRQYYNDSSRWKTIYEANRITIMDRNRLVPGQMLIIP